MAQPLQQPLPQPQKAFPVSWDQFHRDARALAWRLNGAGPFQAIVCITRGGLVPAAIVARELNVRIIETVCVSSYDEPMNARDGFFRRELLMKVADSGEGMSARFDFVLDLR